MISITLLITVYSFIDMIFMTFVATLTIPSESCILSRDFPLPLSKHRSTIDKFTGIKYSVACTSNDDNDEVFTTIIDASDILLT